METKHNCLSCGGPVDQGQILCDRCTDRVSQEAQVKTVNYMFDRVFNAEQKNG